MEQAATDFLRLVQRAKEYDREAFAELYRISVKPVYRYLAARCNGSDLAEELTQEVYLAALSGIGSLRATDEAGLLAWLFRIARHKRADQLRQRYRQPSTSLDAAKEVETKDLPPEEQAERKEKRRLVREAMEQLTPEQREVLVYKYVLEYDNQRTGQLVGRNVNAVNQLHHRGLRALGRLLGGQL